MGKKDLFAHEMESPIQTERGVGSCWRSQTWRKGPFFFLGISFSPWPWKSSWSLACLLPGWGSSPLSTFSISSHPSQTYFPWCNVIRRGTPGVRWYILVFFAFASLFLWWCFLECLRPLAAYGVCVGGWSPHPCCSMIKKTTARILEMKRASSTFTCIPRTCVCLGVSVCGVAITTMTKEGEWGVWGRNATRYGTSGRGEWWCKHFVVAYLCVSDSVGKGRISIGFSDQIERTWWRRYQSESEIIRGMNCFFILPLFASFSEINRKLCSLNKARAGWPSCIFILCYIDPSH